MLTRRYVAATILSAWIGQSAHAACPSEGFMSPDMEMKTVNVVVVGKTISQEDSAAGPGGTWVDGTYYTVLVSSTPYGSAAKKIRVFSENSSGRFPMLLHEAYLLFISTCDGVQYIDAKGNSGVLNRRKDVLRQVLSWKHPSR